MLLLNVCWVYLDFPPVVLMWLLSGANLCHPRAAAVQPCFAPLWSWECGIHPSAPAEP